VGSVCGIASHFLGLLYLTQELGMFFSVLFYIMMIVDVVAHVFSQGVLWIGAMGCE
jgi:hypothetical protein